MVKFVASTQKKKKKTKIVTLNYDFCVHNKYYFKNICSKWV